MVSHSRCHRLIPGRYPVTARKPRSTALSAATAAAQAVPCGHRNRGCTQRAGPVRRYGTTAKTQVNRRVLARCPWPRRRRRAGRPVRPTQSRRRSRAGTPGTASATACCTATAPDPGCGHGAGNSAKSQPKQRQNWPVFVFRGSSLFPQVTAFLPPNGAKLVNMIFVTYLTWAFAENRGTNHRTSHLRFCRLVFDSCSITRPQPLPPVFDKSHKLCIGPNSTTAHAA